MEILGVALQWAIFTLTIHFSLNYDLRSELYRILSLKVFQISYLEQKLDLLKA